MTRIHTSVSGNLKSSSARSGLSSHDCLSWPANLADGASISKRAARRLILLGLNTRRERPQKRCTRTDSSVSPVKLCILRSCVYRRVSFQAGGDSFESTVGRSAWIPVREEGLLDVRLLPMPKYILPSAAFSCVILIGHLNHERPTVRHMDLTSCLQRTEMLDGS